jgi:CRISPR-associated endonuclease/helicase Cas3
MERKLYARSAGRGEADWEQLERHLLSVGECARAIARKFGAAEFGSAAGLLHDLGKAKPDWQRYLRGQHSAVSHSAEGALAAVKRYARKTALNAPVGRLLAFAIAGHHSGLSNGNLHGGGVTPLDDRLENAETLEPWLALPALDKPPQPLRSAGKDPLAWAFFIRMLFSTLVDADRLVSEEADNRASGRATLRNDVVGLSDVKSKFDASMARTFGGQSDASELATFRAEVLSDCRAAASLTPGLFTLTVPTGGGKTLSSLAFALDHAAHHAQRFDRIIYVIPFTSIIDQTAEVFRGVLNEPDAILEHHSAFDDEKLDRLLAKENDYGKERLHLAAQNWDRPVVVTTAVQFF